MARQPTNINDRLALQAIRNADRARFEASKSHQAAVKPGTATALFNAEKIDAKPASAKAPGQTLGA